MRTRLAEIVKDDILSDRCDSWHRCFNTSHCVASHPGCEFGEFVAESDVDPSIVDDVEGCAAQSGASMSLDASPTTMVRRSIAICSKKRPPPIGSENLSKAS